MDVLLAGVLLLGAMVPFAVWMTVGAVRAQRTRAATEDRAPEPTYGANEPGRSRHALGTAWARTTTHLD